MKRKQRYSLVTDDSCHWYMIPSNMREAWDVWMADESDDGPAGGCEPEWAERLAKGVSFYSFTDLQLDDDYA